MTIEDLQPLDIAPCGVNCRACSAHLDSKKPCFGCRAPQEFITRKNCENCAKKKCAASKGVTWCFECESFPCGRVKDLSKRYKRNYNVDLIENGLHARKDMNSFLDTQIIRFTCRYCGGIIDQHNHQCSLCANDECL